MEIPPPFRTAQVQPSLSAIPAHWGSTACANADPLPIDRTKSVNKTVLTLKPRAID